MFRSATRREVFSSGGGTAAAPSQGSVSCEAERVAPATGGSGAGVATTRFGSLTACGINLGAAGLTTVWRALSGFSGSEMMACGEYTGWPCTFTLAGVPGVSNGGRYSET